MPKVGRGRPSLGEHAKRQPLNMRTDSAMRERIEQAAAISGLSLSQEVERRLITSFIQDDFLGGPQTAPFSRMLIGTIAEIERQRGASWRDDLPTWWAVKEATDALLKLCRPAPDQELREVIDTTTPPYLEASRRADDAKAALEAFVAGIHEKYDIKPNTLGAVVPMMKATDEERLEYDRLVQADTEAYEAFRVASDQHIAAIQPLVEAQRSAKAMGVEIAEATFAANRPKRES